MSGETQTTAESAPQDQAQAPRQNRRARAAEASIDIEAMLERCGLSDLPEVFAMRDVDGSILQERAPCFQLQTQCFLGRGLHGTLWEEGATVVYEDQPNQHMQPLNRAGAINYVMWLDSLPRNRTFIDIGDMSEAAHMLAKDPDVTKLPPLQYQKAVMDLATELKLRREGRDARSLPDMQSHNFAPQSGGKSPPMLGAKMSDMSQLGPGMTRGVATVTGPAAGVRKAAPPMGGPLPGR
jgi:hypothetical protein